jgi:quercetin dioxygenase-like cupin family protein
MDFAPARNSRRGSRINAAFSEVSPAVDPTFTQEASHFLSFASCLAETSSQSSSGEFMQNKTKWLLGTGLAASIASVLAFATPTVGAFYNVVLTTGTAQRDINTHSHLVVPGTDEDFSAVVATDGASNIVQQDVKFSPGGTTGWHKHPGIVILTLAADSGPVDWYDSRCGKTVYSAGDSWTEGTRLHDVVNHGTIDAHFFVTYIVAKGVNKRTDEPAPRCARELGLE